MIVNDSQEYRGFAVVMLFLLPFHIVIQTTRSGKRTATGSPGSMGSGRAREHGPVVVDASRHGMTRLLTEYPVQYTRPLLCW